MKAKVVVAAVALLCALLPAALPSSAAADDPRGKREPDGLTRALASGELSRAEYTLERASSLFDLAAARERFGDVDRSDPHSATYLLRDLAARVDGLSGREKQRAQRILARPTHGDADPHGQGYDPDSATERRCRTKAKTSTGDSMKVCFYWVSESGDPDAPDLTDSDTNGIPDWVDQVMAAYDQVWTTEINELDYRMPLEDRAASDGGASLDLYLADIGGDGLYGYCTNDNPAEGTRRQHAYCVIDNDFARRQFAPSEFGRRAMKVTLAHEFFHAVQFAYDWREQLFFMEGTAVWVEDEVFDAIDANYDYLHDSALHQPEVPLDAGNRRVDENFEYGSWLFWRFLSERYDDGVIKDIWEAAAGRDELFPGLRGVLSGRGTTLPTTLGDFALWNRAINADNSGLLMYEEGVDYMEAVDDYYSPWDANHWLGPGQYDEPTTGWRALSLDHLSLGYVLFQREGTNTFGTDLRLRVRLPVAGGQARVLLIGRQYDSGTQTFGDYCSKFYRINIDEGGKGSRVVPFVDFTDCLGQTGLTVGVFLTLVNGGRVDNSTFQYKGAIVP